MSVIAASTKLAPKVPMGAYGLRNVGIFYMPKRSPTSMKLQKSRKTAIFFIWHAHCFAYSVHLVPQTTKGAAQRISLVPRCRPFSFRGSARGRGDELLELTALEHFHHDVGSADEFALHVELGDRSASRNMPLCPAGSPDPAARRPFRMCTPR